MGANAQGIHRGRKRIDMVDGQWLQHGAALPIDVVGLKERIALQHIGNQIAVGQHRALGHARGATGVLQHGQIVAIENRRAIRCFGTGF